MSTEEKRKERLKELVNRTKGILDAINAKDIKSEAEYDKILKAVAKKHDAFEKNVKKNVSNTIKTTFAAEINKAKQIIAKEKAVAKPPVNDTESKACNKAIMEAVQAWFGKKDSNKEGLIKALKDLEFAGYYGFRAGACANTKLVDKALKEDVDNLVKLRESLNENDALVQKYDLNNIIQELKKSQTDRAKRSARLAAEKAEEEERKIIEEEKAAAEQAKREKAEAEKAKEKKKRRNATKKNQKQTGSAVTRSQSKRTTEADKCKEAIMEAVQQWFGERKSTGKTLEAALESLATRGYITNSACVGSKELLTDAIGKIDKLVDLKQTLNENTVLIDEFGLRDIFDRLKGQKENAIQKILDSEDRCKDKFDKLVSLGFYIDEDKNDYTKLLEKLCGDEFKVNISDYIPKKTAPDGDCMFHAIVEAAKCIGTPLMNKGVEIGDGAELRQYLLNYLIAGKLERINDIFAADSKALLVADSIKRLELGKKQPAGWGTYVEMAMIAKLFQLKISVVDENEQKIVNGVKIEADSIILLWTGAHYDWLSQGCKRLGDKKDVRFRTVGLTMQVYDKLLEDPATAALYVQYIADNADTVHWQEDIQEAPIRQVIPAGFKNDGLENLSSFVFTDDDKIDFYATTLAEARDFFKIRFADRNLLAFIDPLIEYFAAKVKKNNRFFTLSKKFYELTRKEQLEKLKDRLGNNTGIGSNKDTLMLDKLIELNRRLKQFDNDGGLTDLYDEYRDNIFGDEGFDNPDARNSITYLTEDTKDDKIWDYLTEEQKSPSKKKDILSEEDKKELQRLKNRFDTGLNADTDLASLTGKPAIDFLTNYDLVKELMTQDAEEKMEEWFDQVNDKDLWYGATLWYKRKGGNIVSFAIACMEGDPDIVANLYEGNTRSKITSKNSMELIEIHNLSEQYGTKESIRPFAINVLEKYEKADYVFVSPAIDKDDLKRIQKQRKIKTKLTIKGLKELYIAWGLTEIVYSETPTAKWSHRFKDATKDGDIFMIAEKKGLIYKMGDGWVRNGSEVPSIGHDAARDDVQFEKFVYGKMKYQELENYASSLGLIYKGRKAPTLKDLKKGIRQHLKENKFIYAFAKVTYLGEMTVKQGEGNKKVLEIENIKSTGNNLAGKIIRSILDDFAKNGVDYLILSPYLSQNKYLHEIYHNKWGMKYMQLRDEDKKALRKRNVDVNELIQETKNYTVDPNKISDDQTYMIIDVKTLKQKDRFKTPFQNPTEVDGEARVKEVAEYLGANEYKKIVHEIKLQEIKDNETAEDIDTSKIGTNKDVENSLTKVAKDKFGKYLYFYPLQKREEAKKAKEKAAEAAKKKEMKEMATLVDDPKVGYIRITFSGGGDDEKTTNALEQLIKHGEAFEEGGREINTMNKTLAAVRVMNAANGATYTESGLNENDVGLFLYGHRGIMSWYGGATGIHKKKGQYEDEDTMRNILLRIIDPSAKEKENKEKEQEDHFSALQKDYKDTMESFKNLDKDPNLKDLGYLIEDTKDFLVDFGNYDIQDYYGKNAKKAKELVNELKKEQAKQEEAFSEEKKRISDLNEEKEKSKRRSKKLNDLRVTGQLSNEMYSLQDFKALKTVDRKSILKQYHEQENILEDLHLMSTTMLRKQIVGKVPLSIVSKENPDLGTTSKQLKGKDAVNFIRNYDLLQELATPGASEEVPDWFSLEWNKKNEQLNATLFYKTENNKILFLVIACLGADERLLPSLKKDNKQQNNITQDNTMEFVEIHNLSGKKGQTKQRMGPYLVEILEEYKKEKTEYVFVAPSEDLELLQRLNEQRGSTRIITAEGLKEVYRAWGMELINYEKDKKFDGKGYSHNSKQAFYDADVFMIGQIDTVINNLSDGRFLSGADVDTLGYDASTNDITIRQFVNGEMTWNELRSYAKNLGLKKGKKSTKSDVVALIADYLISEKTVNASKQEIFSKYVEPPKKSAVAMEEENRFLSGKMSKKNAIDYAKSRLIVIKGNKKGDRTAKNYAEKLREKIAQERGVDVDTITTEENKYDLYDLTSIWDDQEDLMVPPPSSFGLADRKAREFMVFE